MARRQQSELEAPLLKKVSPPTKTASARARARLAKAVSISPTELAFNTWIASRWSEPQFPRRAAWSVFPALSGFGS